MKKIFAIVMLFALLTGLCACGGSSGSSSSGGTRSGFTGSDGKYHKYVPEFGDDVNNWMADNW